MFIWKVTNKKTGKIRRYGPIQFYKGNGPSVSEWIDDAGNRYEGKGGYLFKKG